MRRYQQLLLFIISVVSVTLVLIYRHEYNRLHYVLEVFNFFGAPCNFTDLQISNNILNHHDWGPDPVWQENDVGYVYSAFWDKNEAKALGISETAKETPRYCYLWYEDKEKPVIGKFKYSKLGHDEMNKYTLFVYHCNVPINQVPYAVSFIGSKNLPYLKKILLRNVDVFQLNFNMTICVLPTSFDKFTLLEFLSFHQVIGIDSFIVYNSAIPHKLMKTLSNFSTRLGIKITFLPWNYPKAEGNLTRLIIENDCVLRAIGESKNLITLETNEYIVPTKYHNFNELLSDFNGKSQRLSLPVQDFCVMYKSRNKPVALQNTKVSRSKNTLVYNIYKSVKVPYSNNSVNTQILDRGFASIHKYIDCDGKDKYYEDNSILKFSTDFIRSTLVQLVIHNKI